MSNIGITSLGGYIPRNRLSRRAVAEAHNWANPNLKGLGKGERAFCSHDEDSITMGVAAARAALEDLNKTDISSILFASTSMPFTDRQNASIIGEALGLSEDLQTMDISGSQRAGTSALIHALTNTNGNSLVIASEKCLTKPGSVEEFIVGDGSAAITIGRDKLLAKFIGSHTVSRDFVDHYRSSMSKFNYGLEERWILDEGLLKIVPDAIDRLLTKTDTKAESISKLIIPGVASRAAQKIAAKCAIPATAVEDNLREKVGDMGSAHALVMLTNTLQSAAPGEKILVAGFGQGCDALLFETTENITRARKDHGIQALLDNGTTDTNYLRFLSFNGLIEMHWGMRAERDNRTAHSAYYRNRKAITGFVGGLCESCNTTQFPMTKICVNPNCGATDTQREEPFSEKTGQIKSFTEDWLAHSPNPPLMYGNVRFEGNSTLMMEFTDFDPGQLSVGTPVRMVFRIKDQDNLRSFHRYFWKAAPATTVDD